VFVISLSLPSSLSVFVFCFISSPLRLYAFIIYPSDLFQSVPKKQIRAAWHLMLYSWTGAAFRRPTGTRVALTQLRCFLKTEEMFHCDFHQPQQHLSQTQPATLNSKGMLH